MLHPLLKAYSNAIRPKMGYFGLLIFCATARFARADFLNPTLWITAFALVMCICACVLTNDYVDRAHDTKKNRNLVADHPDLTKRIILMMWSITLLFVALIAITQPLTAIILLVMIVISITYSWMRTLPFVSAIAVALSYALICPLAWSFSTQSTLADLGMIFATVFCAVHGRETIADLDDQHIDVDYKATIPVCLGTKYARIIMMFTFSIGWITACSISSLMLIGTPLYIYLIYQLLHPPLHSKNAYPLVDMQTFLFIFVLALS